MATKVENFKYDPRSDCYTWGDIDNGIGIHIVQTNPLRFGGTVVVGGKIKEMPTSTDLEKTFLLYQSEFYKMLENL